MLIATTVDVKHDVPAIRLRNAEPDVTGTWSLQSRQYARAAKRSMRVWTPVSEARLILDEWASTFQAPDAAELALFDPPPDSH